MATEARERTRLQLRTGHVEAAKRQMVVRIECYIRIERQIVNVLV